MDLANATIADLNASFTKGTLTAEKLTEMYLARIAAYDKQAPTITAAISLNPNALREARALDAERKAGKVRGPLHGIPIVLKDNFNSTTHDDRRLELREGSISPSDACRQKLRTPARYPRQGQSQRVRLRRAGRGSAPPSASFEGPDHMASAHGGPTRNSRTCARNWRPAAEPGVPHRAVSRNSARHDTDGRSVAHTQAWRVG